MAAEVGSVYINVRAITDKVGPDIQKAFSSLNSGSISKSGDAVGKTFSNAIGKSINGNVFEKAGKALSNFGGEAGSARDKLFQLSKASFIGGTAIASLFGTVSALIGGFGALAGAVGGAAPAIMGLVGSLVAVKAAASVAQLALGGIMQAVGKATTSYAGYGKSVAAVAKMYRDLKYAQEDAALGQKRAILELEKARANLIRTQDMPANSMARKEALLAYQEAELNLRKAKDKNKEAGLEAKDPNIFSGTDPFAGLTASQKEFAQYLVSLKPKFDELKEAAAKGFLPILKKNIQGLMKDVFPTFKQGIKDIAVGLGGLTTNLSNAIRDPKNVELLGKVMKNIGDNLPIMGTIMGNIYGGMLTVLKASDPLVKRFLKFLETKTKSFSDWLKAKDASGELEVFFDKAGNIMDKLYKIFENTLGGLGAIIGANFEPGSGGWKMLDWLEKVTGGWAAMDDTVAGKNSLKKYFQDVAVNSTKILDSIGSLTDEFMELGANPAIGEMFDNLAKGAPAMGELGKKLVEAGPALGQLVADITIFINELTDTQAIKNFFGIIDAAVQGVTAILKDPIVGPIIKILGQIHAAIFGIIVLTRATGFISKYVGETQAAFKTFGTFLDKFPALDGIRVKGMDAMAAVKGSAKDAFTFAKTKAKDFATAMVGNIKTGVKAVGSSLKDIGVYTAQMTKTAGGKLVEFGKTLGGAFVTGASKAWDMLKNIASSIWAGVKASVAFLIANPWILIAAAIAAVVAGLVYFFTQTKEGKKIWADFTKFIDDSIKNIGKWFSDVWKNVTKWASDAWTGMTKGVTDFVNGIPKTIDNIGKFFSDVFKGIPGFITSIIPNLMTNIGKMVTSIVGGIDKIFPGFKTVFNNVINFFKTVIINPMISMVEKFVNGFINGINFLIGGLNKLKVNIPSWVPLIGGKTFGVNIKPIAPIRLTPLAEGGTVMPRPGGMLAQIAEAGRPERVEPLDANGLSNRDKAMIDFLTKNKGTGGQPIQIIVNPSANMNERDIAEMVSRKLAFELRRGAY